MGKTYHEDGKKATHMMHKPRLMRPIGRNHSGCIAGMVAGNRVVGVEGRGVEWIGTERHGTAGLEWSGTARQGWARHGAARRGKAGGEWIGRVRRGAEWRGQASKE